VEACSEESVARVKGEKVLRGLLGVHKKWVKGESGGGGIARGLRLIANIIPANAVLRPLFGASQSMGYAPRWTRVFVEDGETMLAYSEHPEACFHLYAVP
jgi:hypothetical protein